MTVFNEALTHCAQDLDEETRLMVYSFTQMSDAVIPELIDLDIASEKINQELNQDINKIFSELSLDDTPGLYFSPLGRVAILTLL